MGRQGGRCTELEKLLFGKQQVETKNIIFHLLLVVQLWNKFLFFFSKRKIRSQMFKKLEMELFLKVLLDLTNSRCTIPYSFASKMTLDKFGNSRYVLCFRRRPIWKFLFKFPNVIYVDLLRKMIVPQLPKYSSSRILNLIDRNMRLWLSSTNYCDLELTHKGLINYLSSLLTRNLSKTNKFIFTSNSIANRQSRTRI